MDIGIKNHKVALLLFALLLLVSLVVLVRGTGLPYRGAERTLPGLGEEAQVRWDRWGVPHLSAGSETDLARLLGWIHANDRMTQMEIGRRAGRGLLSQAFGEDFFEADVYFRTLRLEATADRMYAEAAESSRAWLDAYAEGVNAWVTDREKSMPPELRFLGIDVEPWQPRDGYLFALLMAVDLSFWDDRPEEERFLWLRHFGVDGLRDLLGDPDVHVPEEIAAMATGSWTPPEPASPDEPVTEDDIALGSNNWAIEGSRAAGGLPMIANDPHLGLNLPSVWYQVHLRAPGFSAQGMTLPGTPGVVIGRGEHVAWALTNVMLDDHDVFLEHVRDDDGGQSVLRLDEAGVRSWLPIQTERVDIPIRGGASRSATLRRTDIGPLLDADAELGLPARSLRWTALEGGDPMLALYRMAKVRSLDEAVSAAKAFTCPAQNLVMTFGPESDDPGVVAYTVLGGVPDRLRGDGRLPAPAWDPSYGWAGLRPRSTNPVVRAADGNIFRDGILITANHDVRPPDYELPLVSEFFPTFRADRIRQRLDERSDWDVEGFADVQADALSLFAQQLVPALDQDVTGDAQRAADVLRAWDFEMPAEAGSEPGKGSSGAAALFILAQKHLMLEIFADEQASAGLDKPLGHRDSLLRIVQGNALDRWWDDVATPDVTETRTEIVQRALDAAWRQGAERWGDDVTQWDHGELHQLTLRHRLDAVPVLGWWLRRGPWKMPGHATTVLALGARWVDDGSRQEITYGPSMRWIVDWSDPDRAWSVIPGGQAGHPADPHYADQMDLYLDGEVHEAPWTETAIEEATVAVTRFVP